MNSTSTYRTNAEQCLRMAATAQDERDKPFWLVLAQSWLHLAERAARNAADFKTDAPRSGWRAH